MEISTAISVVRREQKITLANISSSAGIQRSTRACSSRTMAGRSSGIGCLSCVRLPASIVLAECHPTKGIYESHLQKLPGCAHKVNWPGCRQSLEALDMSGTGLRIFLFVRWVTEVVRGR